MTFRWDLVISSAFVLLGGAVLRFALPPRKRMSNFFAAQWAVLAVLLAAGMAIRSYPWIVGWTTAVFIATTLMFIELIVFFKHVRANDLDS